MHPAFKCVAAPSFVAQFDFVSPVVMLPRPSLSKVSSYHFVFYYLDCTYAVGFHEERKSTEFWFTLKTRPTSECVLRGLRLGSFEKGYFGNIYRNPRHQGLCLGTGVKHPIRPPEIQTCVRSTFSFKDNEQFSIRCSPSLS